MTTTVCPDWCNDEHPHDSHSRHWRVTRQVWVSLVLDDKGEPHITLDDEGDMATNGSALVELSPAAAVALAKIERTHLATVDGNSMDLSWVLECAAAYAEGRQAPPDLRRPPEGYPRPYIGDPDSGPGALTVARGAR